MPVAFAYFPVPPAVGPVKVVGGLRSENDGLQRAVGIHGDRATSASTGEDESSIGCAGNR